MAVGVEGRRRRRKRTRGGGGWARASCVRPFCRLDRAHSLAMAECGQSKKQNLNVKRSRIEALNRRAARVKCSMFQVWHND